jgi:hypothetical protein
VLILTLEARWTVPVDLYERDLYERDIFEWSELQADLLRRAANGERVSEVDWPNVIEEIADVGRDQINAVESFLRQSVIHLFRLHLLPDDIARMHWLTELGNFLVDATSGRHGGKLSQSQNAHEVPLSRYSTTGSLPLDAGRPSGWRSRPASCPPRNKRACPLKQRKASHA